MAEIESWQKKLEAAGDPKLTRIEADLGRLRDELVSNEIDRKTVGDLLESLGRQTSELGPGNLPPFVIEKLQTLGRLLSDEGRNISG